MPALRRRTPDQVAALARELQQQLAARLLSASALQSLLERFKFRDRHGDAWTQGPLTQAWYLHQGNRWVASPAAPVESLDGAADLELSERPVTAGWQASAPAEGEVARRPDPAADPAEYFRQAVGRVSRTYDSGALPSDAAEAELQALYAVDASGTAWMLGVLTGTWYTFSTKGWQRSPQPLDREVLEGARSIEAAKAGTALQEKVRRFLSRTTDLIPESIVPAWKPPIDFPEPVITCPQCHALNVGEVRSCISCERPIVGAGLAGVPGQTSAPLSPPVNPAPPASAAAPPRTTAAPAPRATAPAKRSRLMWFIGGGCCLGIVCVALAAVLVVGPGLVPSSIAMGNGSDSPAAEVEVPVVGDPALPNSDILLEDSFEDSSRTAVPLFGTETMEFEIDSGSRIGLMTAHNPGVLVAMYESPIVADFEATLELAPLDPVPGAGYGMVFRSDDAAEGLEHYYLLLAHPADGDVVLSRWGPGGFAELGRVPFTPEASGGITLLVRAQGGHIEVEVDGQPGIQVLDAAAEPGIFGLAMLSPKDGDKVEFWNIMVEPLTP